MSVYLFVYYIKISVNITKILLQIVGLDQLLSVAVRSHV